MKVVNVKTETFTEEVENSKEPMMIDFYATWCGPCKMVGQVIDEIAKEYDGNVKICKIDVDAEPELAVKYRIMSVPTILTMRNGEVIKRVTGARTKNNIISMLDELK
ncbi:MAG: thioredoxin [Lachnospiraceae bacterium]|nr:thioredoxin [Lachnospiraceae bacterium]